MLEAGIRIDGNVELGTASEFYAQGVTVGVVEVSDNRVGGNLQCKENNPAPTGGGNIVQGNKEDQCARL